MYDTLSSSSSTNAVSLVNVNGSVTVNNSSSAISGGNSSFTYPGTITNTTGRSLDITNKTSGTVAFGSAISDTGTGILLDNNDQGAGGATATINFTGVTLTNIAMNGGKQVGINGFNVTNFILTNSNILNMGDQVREDGIKFESMFGTSSITNTTFDTNQGVSIDVVNQSGTLNSLTMTGNTIKSVNAPNGSFGVEVSMKGSASGDVIFNNNLLNNIFSNCIQTGNGGTGVLEVTIQSNRFDKGTVRGCGASAINVTQQDTGTTRFNISKNCAAASPTFLGGQSSHAITSIRQVTRQAPTMALLKDKSLTTSSATPVQ